MTWQAIAAIYIVIGCVVVFWMDYSLGPPGESGKRQLFKYLLVTFLYPVIFGVIVWQVWRDRAWRSKL